MIRILEPEVMEDEKGVLAYGKADFSDSNNLFVKTLLATYPLKNRAKILDLGCGPGDIALRFAKTDPNLVITALDASEPMLAFAQKVIKEEKLENQINLIKGRIPNLQGLDVPFDVICSKDLLHHIPDPLTFWNEVKRLSESGTAIFIMDLIRPESEEEARIIVNDLSSHEPQVLQDDFYYSLLAAFSIDEVKDNLKNIGLNLTVEPLGLRHFIVKGII